MLVLTGFGQPKLMAQFDGSTHRSRHIGGAGAALFHFDSTGMTLLDWGSQALPNCVDNIIAEGKGACLAITLYERYVEHCFQHRILPFPLDTIQGDIKSLLQHLDFRSRFRRLDMVGSVDQFHRKRSRLAPHSLTEYRPREANVIADHLAGKGSSYLMQLLLKLLLLGLLLLALLLLLGLLLLGLLLLRLLLLELLFLSGYPKISISEVCH